MSLGESVGDGLARGREPEKYGTEWSFRITQARRLVVRGLIRNLVSWDPMARPESGYTAIIGCNAPLLRMLPCNLHFLARQDMHSARQILVVIDRPRRDLEYDAEASMRARFPSLPLEFAYYSRRQRRVCDLLAWPWVQSWLSWSIGISRTRTRYALLHDFDAMLLRPDMLEERFEAIQERRVEYLGTRHYEGNGLVPTNGLATTFELFFDAQRVRSLHRPIDLFNKVTRHHGRRVDFDTFLHAQLRFGTVSTLPIEEQDMVHPSQLICQFEDHRLGRRPVPDANGLVLIPYFLYLGDDPSLLRNLTAVLERREGVSIDIAGRPVDLSRLPRVHLQWLTKQAYRLEDALVGGVRDEVRRYFAAVELFVASAGRGPSPDGGRP